MSRPGSSALSARSALTSLALGGPPLLFVSIFFVLPVVSILARGLVPVLDVVSNGADALRLYDASGWRMLATYPWGNADDDLHIHFYRGPR